MKYPRAGFTIVEVIAVIVIIGILAGISVVGYGAWQRQLASSVLQSDLQGAYGAMENARTFDDTFPSAIPNTFQKQADVVLTFSSLSGDLQYCLTATHVGYPELSYYIASNQKTPTEGDCTADWTAEYQLPAAPELASPSATHQLPFVNVNWNQPLDDGGQTVNEYRVRFTFIGACAGNPDVVITAPRLAANTSNTSLGVAYQYSRNAAGVYILNAQSPLGTCTLFSGNRIGTIYISAITDIGIGPERAFTVTDALI